MLSSHIRSYRASLSPVTAFSGQQVAEMGNKSSKPRVSASSSEEEAWLRLHKEKELEKEKEEEAVRQKEKEEAIARQTDEAAIKIQSTVRGKLAKKEVEKIKIEVNEKKTKFSQWFTRSMSVMSLLHVIVAFVKPNRSDLLNPSSINAVVIIGLLINWFVFFVHGSGNSALIIFILVHALTQPLR